MFSSRHSGPVTSPPHRSGATSSRSTPDRLQAQSTPCSRGIPASHSVRQDSAAAKTTSDTYGRTSQGSLESLATDSAGSSSRTSPGTSPSAQRPSCESYGTWAGRLRLAYSQRKKSARRMKGSAGSAWPTARASENENRTTRSAPSHGNGHGLVLGGVAGDFMAAANWTAPQALDVTARGAGQVPTSKAGNACLARDAQMWGTPRASDGEKGGPNMAFGAGGTPLPSQAANWPTPAAQNVKGSSEGSIHRADGKSRMDILHYAAEQGFSLPAPETQPHGLPSSDPRLTWRRLRRLVISTHGRGVWKRMAASGGKRRLNPSFVEWLMGWPPGHSLCACSETAFCLWQRRMRGALSAMPTASAQWIWRPPAETTPPMQMSLL
jgi:hypothetical protein